MNDRSLIEYRAEIEFNAFKQKSSFNETVIDHNALNNIEDRTEIAQNNACAITEQLAINNE